MAKAKAAASTGTAPTLDQVRAGDPNISPEQQALAEALIGQGAVEPAIEVEDPEGLLAGGPSKMTPAAAVGAEGERLAQERAAAEQAEIRAQLRAEREAEHAAIAAKYPPLPDAVMDELRTQHRAKGIEADETEAAMYDFRRMVGELSDERIASMPPAERAEAAEHFRSGAARVRSEGSVHMAALADSIASKLDPMPGAIAPRGPQPMATPPLRGLAPPAKRPVLRHSQQATSAGLHPAPRPQLRRTQHVDVPAMEHEVNAMLGIMPAPRPHMPTIPQGYGTWSQPRPPEQRGALQADPAVQWYRVEEGRRFHGKQGTFDLPAGSVISTQTHDVAMLRNQHARLTLLDGPPMLPRSADFAGQESPTIKGNVRMEVPVDPRTLAPLPQEAKQPEPPSPIGTTTAGQR